MPDDADQDFALHTELGHEAKRLATHPIQEIARLEHEADEGEADTTLAILIAIIAVVAAVVVAFVLLAAYAAGALFGSLTGA